MRFLVDSRKLKVVSGYENMIGEKVQVVKITKTGYKVLYHGELWNATSSEQFGLNDKVIVNNISGLTFDVRSIK